MTLPKFGCGILSKSLDAMNTSLARILQVSALVGGLAIAGFAQAPRSTPIADPEINPVTGQQYLDLRNADVVESLIFLKEFKLAHPDETAVLLLPKIIRLNQAMHPAVAYTRKGEVCVYSCQFGARKALGVKLEDLATTEGRELVHARFMVRLRNYLGDTLTKQGVAVGTTLDTWDGFAKVLQGNTVPHVVPQWRAGDSDDVQVARAFARLQQLGFSSTIVSSVGKNGQRKLWLVMDWEGLSFGWTQSWGSYYSCLAERPMLDGVLSGLFFSIDYKQAHPAETVKLVAYETPGDPLPWLHGKVLFTRDGQMRVLYRGLGELAIALTVADLADEDKITRVEGEHFEQVREASYVPNRTTPDHRVDYPPVDKSAGTMLAEMQKRGVTASLDRKTNPADPILHFQWDGKNYVYTEALGCFAGTQPPPL